MKYVLERISTVQACDVLLAGAKKKKLYLERRVRNLGESLVTFRKRLDQVHEESAQVRSSLEVFTGVYGSLSEGKDKVNMNIRIKRLELQQAILEKKATTYNVGALLVKEMQYNRLDSRVSALEDYIAAVEQRSMALETPALRIVQPAVLLRQPVARPGFIPQDLAGKTIFPLSGGCRDTSLYRRPGKLIVRRIYAANNQSAVWLRAENCVEVAGAVANYRL